MQIAPQPMKSAAPTPWWRGPGGIIALFVVLAILIAGGFIIFSMMSVEDDPKDASGEIAALVTETTAEESLTWTPAPTITTAPTQTESPAPLTETPTVIAAHTETPTEAAQVVAPAVTDMPTTAPTLAPTNTVEPTALPTQAAAPTVKYPNGRHVMLYYDTNSLYLHNLSGDRIALGSFAMERLFASGATANYFDGFRWAQFYPYVQPQSCATLLMANSSPFLNPGQCQGNNAEVWATRGLSLDFWTPQNDSTQFRVLWNDEEVARCEIAAGSCDVFIP
jgi:hypothetical protein